MMQKRVSWTQDLADVKQNVNGLIIRQAAPNFLPLKYIPLVHEPHWKGCRPCPSDTRVVVDLSREVRDMSPGRRSWVK